MEVKILKNEKDTLELELIGADQSLAQLLAMKLNDEKSVDFASYKLEHPLLAHPKLILKVSKGDPVKLLLSSIGDLIKDTEDFKKQFSDIVKK